MRILTVVRRSFIKFIAAGVNYLLNRAESAKDKPDFAKSALAAQASRG
ncbi:MAG: hypothetical protein JNM12_09010 [Alphaproteobacteria bacterium]|nr:hypothetical protein [Alphaproteobacteria bacterium]